MGLLIVCDLDGTLCDCRHRQHLAGDWDAFHAGISDDGLFIRVHDVLLALIESRLNEHGSEPATLIFLTGRPEDYRSETTEWINDVAFLFEEDDYAELIMRPKDDYTRDVDLKPQLLDQWLSDNDNKWAQTDILILEDRESVVTMWRDKGYTCFQTAQGAF
jgi:hypothetical protein